MKEAESAENEFPARKFRVAVEISDIAGEPQEVQTVSGTLHQCGDFVLGTFNTETKKFTPKPDAAAWSAHSVQEERTLETVEEIKDTELIQGEEDGETV